MLSHFLGEIGSVSNFTVMLKGQDMKDISIYVDHAELLPKAVPRAAVEYILQLKI